MRPLQGSQGLRQAHREVPPPRAAGAVQAFLQAGVPAEQGQEGEVQEQAHKQSYEAPQQAGEGPPEERGRYEEK